MSNEDLNKRLQSVSRWDFKLVLSIVTLITTASILHLMYSVGYLNGQEAFASALQPEKYTNFDFAYWLNAIHIAIAAGFILATIGLWSRKAAGFLLSSVALGWVCITYVWWYRETLHFLENIAVTEDTKLHDPFFKEMGMLRGASRWDVLVLLVALVVLLWLVRTWLQIVKSSKSKVTPN